MWKVSEIDAKILKELLQDGRKSFADIAKEFGVTKNKIWKRYRAMEKKGIITGATIQMNFASFGYDALATLLISVEAQQIDKVMTYIGKITEVHAYRQYNSIYNVRAVTALKDLKELDHVKGVVRLRLPITCLKTYIWTDVKNIPENLKLTSTQKNAAGSSETYSSTVNPHQGKSRIDELDLQIVEKLALNGRVSFNKIAREIETSTDTVIKRYQKLKKNNAIKVSVQINLNKIGYNAMLDFNIAFASPGNLSGIIASLAKIPDVLIITKTSGDYDLQVTSMIRDVEQMYTIQDEIAKISGITKIEVSARKIPYKWPTNLQYISTF
jgi:DNA-binding Lrp family transcriptional regulator